MPVNLPNLYTLPGDIFDYLGSEQAQLCLDDHNQATGQILNATALAAVGATTISVTPLSSPLLRGTVLEWDGGGMDAVVQAVLTAAAPVGSTSLSVSALAAAINASAQARDSGVNVALAQRLVIGCSHGTARVKLYCCSRYDDSQLVQSWSVNRWATVCGARWLRKRRSQTAPKGIEDDFEEALEEMRQVQVGCLQIEDIGTRTSGWPFVTNTTVQIGYETARVRVEQSISEATPTQFGQFVDWSSVFSLDW